MKLCVCLVALCLFLSGCGDLVGVVTRDTTGWDLSAVYNNPDAFREFAQDNWETIESQPGFVEPPWYVLWWLGVDSNPDPDPNGG